ncbi:uncharacterized protein JN550_005464 [Neoarthrinium moseri]|uniref:uncharacterized protein n=1 Tax=Neoarthrinium moseri TaxID=1658444 RepID=UPI001FDC71B8|nr:uncharacterized protein JN550_005464 [Neoarthrinium moseri]KAI1869874.1 hypothetical protein JN550_005464 [Neoarthrinium moseri]
MRFISSILAVSFLLTANAENWEGVPTVGQDVNGLKYMGCAIEIPGRVLTGPSFSDDSMTIEACSQYCTNNFFTLSGVEYGRECYCGKYIAPPALLPGTPSQCDMTCKNNKAISKQRCGGYGRMAVFNNTNYAGPGSMKNYNSWSYDSCYMEPQWGRALTNQVKAEDTMTVQKCLDACTNGKYKYAGLEYGRECWCGNTKAGNLEDASDPSCAMQCDMVCGGNHSQMCGGRGAINLYKTSQVYPRNQDWEDYHDYGHGPTKRDVDVAARKGRFIKVRRSSRLSMNI